MYCFLFIVVFCPTCPIAISFLSLFHHWLFIYLQWGWVIFSLSLGLYLFDIDIGDKDYENYMVLKILI